MKNVKRLFGVMLLMLLSQAAWSFSFGFASSNPETIMSFIQNNNAIVYLSVFFGLGILLAFTPCVLPMVPILSGIIVGQESLSTSKAFKLSLSYVLGMAITYAAAGILAGFMGSTIQTLMQRPSVIVGFSLVFVLMGLSMFGLFELRLPSSINNRFSLSNKKSKKQGLFSVALMGIISTLIVSPCVTAPLIGVLTYIGQNGRPLTGGLILFTMALGMGVPLLLVGAGYGSVLPKTGSWMTKIKQLFGIIMLAIAIWLLERVLTTTLTHFLWATLLIVSGLVLGAFKPTEGKAGRLFQIIAMIALIGGGMISYNAVSTMVVQPKLNHIQSEVAPFIKVNTLQAIEQELARAQKENKVAFLEFSASWCSDCQEMDSKVFSQSEVAKAMNGLVNLKVDITDNSEEVATIKNNFAIYGTPTMLFFDPSGKPLNELTVVGVINKQAMLDLLKKATSLS